MAEILNQKEEVLTVELTKHGKKQLAMGIYRPIYFSFFDDSIIYDNKYSKVNEEDVNNIETRILDHSIYLKALNLTEDKLRERLGTSNTLNEYAPAWYMNILRGKIIYNQEISSYYKKRFTVEDIVYNVKINKEDNNIPTITGDYLLIDLKELNVSDDISNYEIEIFTYDEQQGGKNVAMFDIDLERRLMFSAKKSNIIDDILYEDSEIQTNYYNVSVSKEDVMYYYDVLVDEEIDSEFIAPRDVIVDNREVYKSDYTGPIVPCP